MSERAENEELDTTNNEANPPVVTGTTVPVGHEPTPENSLASTNTATLELLREIRQQNEAQRLENVRLSAEINSLRNPPPPAKTPEQEQEEYFRNPLGAIQSKIEEALRPLKQQTQQSNRQQEIARLTEKFSNDPRFKKHWNTISETVGQFVSQTADISENNFQAIVLASIGAAQTGFIPSKNPEIVTGSEVPVPLDGSTSRTNNVPTPPNVRPSAPAAPRTQSETKKKEYTEIEKRLMRENKMTEDQWEKYMNARPNEVIDVKEKK